MGVLLALSAPLGPRSAEAAQDWFRYADAVSAKSIRTGAATVAGRGPRYPAARQSRSGALQCVPFARDNSGIELVGNAVTWWNKAAGTYERGNRPEMGAVLSFRATGRMVLGHVAVVSRVIDSRNVQIDHANWVSRGAISRNIGVIDVSPNNDWTAVRVALPRGDDYGSVYPTNGFIYARADRGTMVANTGVTPSPTPAGAGLGAPPPDVEVAEAADDVLQTARRVVALSRTPRAARRPLVLGAQDSGRPYF